MLRPLASRLAAAPPRTRALLAAGAGAAALLLAFTGDPLLSTAGRASLAALALAAVVWSLRRRAGATEPVTLVEVAGLRTLSRDAAVAVLRVHGRALLVGYGPDGVRLLADLGPSVTEVHP